MLYPISTRPLAGGPLNPAPPSKARGSRRRQYHRYQPAWLGAALSSESRKNFCGCSSFSGGGQCVGRGTSSIRANAGMSLISAFASAMVPATSSRRDVVKRKPFIIKGCEGEIPSSPQKSKGTASRPFAEYLGACAMPMRREPEELETLPLLPA